MVYYAHFDRENNIQQLLSEHLRDVAFYGENTLPPTVSFPGLYPLDIGKLCRIENLFHDLGKYTRYFQDYLVNGVNSQFKSHAHISGCFARQLTLQELNHISNRHIRQAWAFLIYLCVRLHHGNLTLKQLFHDGMWSILEVQQAEIKKNWQLILSDLGMQDDQSVVDLPEKIDLQYWRTDQQHFIYMPKHLAGGRLRRDYWFFALQFFFSKLIDADKLDSSGIVRKMDLEIKTVWPRRVQNYIREKHANDSLGEQIKEQRVNVRSQMLSALRQLTDEEFRLERIFTITAPTGIGKTLASLECALYLQERARKVEGYTPRIIVAIPFINIIEQTKKDYQGVFGEDARVLVHHRLADLSQKSRSDETDDWPLEQKLLLAESWESDVVLTTFVQLFHSIITNKNRLLKKYHKLAGAIVILDEIQAVPEKYMPLIGALLRKFSEYYGTRFILMTATQPKVIELGDRLLQQPQEKPMELLKDHEQYFLGLRRTKLVPILSNKMKTEDFLDFFFNTWRHPSSALIVVNTIRRSIDVYNQLNQAKKDGKLPSSTKIYYLSTNIIPRQRRKVIEEVETILNSPDRRDGIILVSTQTIEAGVDLDFDEGYRDLAPIESIIQTAGRINRRGEKGQFFPLYVVQFESDSNYVYDFHHLVRTRDLLKQFPEIVEPHYYTLTKEYYDRLAEVMSFDDSKKIWHEGIIGLDYDVLSEFQLIDSSDVADVFVELDEEATKLADEYKQLMTSENIMRYEKRARLRQIMATMNDYMIQIRISRLRRNRPIKFSVRNDVEDQLFWIPRQQINEFYDINVGFKDEFNEAYLY